MDQLLIHIKECFGWDWEAKHAETEHLISKKYRCLLDVLAKCLLAAIIWLLTPISHLKTSMGKNVMPAMTDRCQNTWINCLPSVLNSAICKTLAELSHIFFKVAFNSPRSSSINIHFLNNNDSILLLKTITSTVAVFWILRHLFKVNSWGELGCVSQGDSYQVCLDGPTCPYKSQNFSTKDGKIKESSCWVYHFYPNTE